MIDLISKLVLYLNVVTHEPTTFWEAMQNQAYLDDIQAEMTALVLNNTWSNVPLPHGKKPIGSKWVYKIKWHNDGIIEHHKAWLIAKGYNQVEGVDNHDIFAPVAKPTTVLPSEVSLFINSMAIILFFMVSWKRKYIYIYLLGIRVRGRLLYVIFISLYMI